MWDEGPWSGGRKFNSQASDPSLSENKSFLGARKRPKTPKPIGTTNPIKKIFAKKIKNSLPPAALVDRSHHSGIVAKLD